MFGCPEGSCWKGVPAESIVRPRMMCSGSSEGFGPDGCIPRTHWSSPFPAPVPRREREKRRPLASPSGPGPPCFLRTCQDVTPHWGFLRSSGWAVAYAELTVKALPLSSPYPLVKPLSMSPDPRQETRKTPLPSPASSLTFRYTSDGSGKKREKRRPPRPASGPAHPASSGPTVKALSLLLPRTPTVKVLSRLTPRTHWSSPFPLPDPPRKRKIKPPRPASRAQPPPPPPDFRTRPVSPWRIAFGG